MMFGYATRETKALMPMPIQIAHTLAQAPRRGSQGGRDRLPRPDGKTQVTVRYENDRPVEIVKVLISTQHAPGPRRRAADQARPLGARRRAGPPRGVQGALHREELLENFLVNPTGKFEIGGPMGDAGLTGRKIIVDTYGGAARHGGGAFSGKDPSKVDRSAAYAARYVAKNVVAAGLADRCEIQVAYAIGVAHPVSLMAQTFGTGKVSDAEIVALVDESSTSARRAFRRYLDLHRPIFQKTAAYGHFGREDPDFTWERTDRADALRARPRGRRGRRRTSAPGERLGLRQACRARPAAATRVPASPGRRRPSCSRCRGPCGWSPRPVGTSRAWRGRPARRRRPGRRRR